MTQKSYALLVAILVTFILLDCFTECGAAKTKRKKPKPGKGKFREDSPADIPKCVFAEKTNFICGSDGLVYWNKENLACGQALHKDLKEAEASTCPSFPKTEEELEELRKLWSDIVKGVADDMTKNAPGTARKKDKNKGKKTERNDKKDHDAKYKRRKNDPRKG